MKKSDRDRSQILRTIVLSVLFVGLVSSSVGASGNEATKTEKATPSSINDFTYTSQRRDPFERGFAFKAKKQLGLEAMKTGYELEELKLVGVMKAGSERFAVMEDMQGKGLLFKKGQNLNSNLWVSEILEERIVLGQRLKGDTRLITLNIPRK